MPYRFICTQAHPWVIGCGDAIHPELDFLHRDPDGGYDVYVCPNCKKTFIVKTDWGRGFDAA